MNRFTDMLKKHRVGLRIIKTGIAVTVCVAVSFLLKLNQPFFAVVATVMSMGKSIDISFRSGKNKAIGVVIGVAVGCAFAWISPANAGLCGIGIIVTLYLCQLFKLAGAATLSCFLFAAMMFLHNFGTHMVPWRFAITSTVDSIIGIAIALVVNLIVMPPNYAEEVKNSCELLHNQIRKSIESADEYKAMDVHAVDACIQKLINNVNMYVSEVKILRWSDKEVFGISCKISTYRMILDELKAVQTIETNGTQEKESLSSELNTVYQYHMSRVHKLFNSIAQAEPTEEE